MYWNLQEGEVGMDLMPFFATADGSPPPVIHLDTDALAADDGTQLSDELWGIYFGKRDRHSVQGGASPLFVVEDDVVLDPYLQTTDIDPAFLDVFCAGLSHAMARFEGCRALYKQAQRRRRVHRRQLPGLRLLPAEPVRDPRLEPRLQDDRRRPGGRERAPRRPLRLLYLFRFERFETGGTPVSSSPYPWS